MKRLPNLLVLSVILGSFVVFSYQQVTGQQYVHVMFNSNCTGTPVFSSTQETFNYTTSVYFNIKVEGLWAAECNQIECTGRVVLFGTGDQCFTLLRMANVHFTRLGHELQSAQELHLFTNANFQGERHVVDANGAIFSSPLPIQSWFYTGVHNWTMFTLLNNEGTEVCSQPTETVVTREFGFTYSRRDNISVGYVKPDCGGEPGTPATPTTITTTSATLYSVTTTTTNKPNVTTTKTTDTTSGAPRIERSFFVIVAVFLAHMVNNW